MKITEIRVGRIEVPLRVPFKTALRRVDSVRDIVVQILTDEGLVGWGEAPPTGVITGDTAEGIVGALRDHIGPTLLGRDPQSLSECADAVQAALLHNPSAKAAADMALWDLHGQILGAPVYRMLGGNRRHIVTDITISVVATTPSRSRWASIPPWTSPGWKPSARQQGRRRACASTPTRRGGPAKPSAS